RRWIASCRRAACCMAPASNERMAACCASRISARSRCAWASVPRVRMSSARAGGIVLDWGVGFICWLKLLTVAGDAGDEGVDEFLPGAGAGVLGEVLVEQAGERAAASPAGEGAGRIRQRVLARLLQERAEKGLADPLPGDRPELLREIRFADSHVHR